MRIAELERLLGRKQLEVDFLKRAFEQVRGAAANRTSDGGRSLSRHRGPLSFEGLGLTVEQQCQLAEVSRAGYYRYLQQTAPEQADLLLRARLQELAVAHHRLRGYRMLTALLRREGQLVNHKRVLRLMRQDNLLSLRRKKKVLRLIGAYLADLPEPGPTCEINGADELWVADITFIRLRNEFIYLAVVLDAYSRRVIGWDLARTLQAELAVRALRWHSASVAGKPRG